MIRAVIFDCFGVLATDAWLAFCDSLPENADRDTAGDLNKAYGRGMITQREYEDGIQQATGRTPPDISHLSAGQMAKNEQLLKYIHSLKAEYKIGLISNIASDWITRELLSAEDQNVFDTMVFSYQVGMIKPDPEIYQLACDRMNVQPNEVVMVDDRQQYVDGAVAVGMQGIVYTNFQEFRTQLEQLVNPN